MALSLRYKYDRVYDCPTRIGQRLSLQLVNFIATEFLVFSRISQITIYR